MPYKEVKKTNFSKDNLRLETRISDLMLPVVVTSKCVKSIYGGRWSFMGPQGLKK